MKLYVACALRGVRLRFWHPFFSVSFNSLSQNTFKSPLIYNLVFLSIKSAGLETGINRYKTETENNIKTDTENNWKPVLTSKSKPEKIGYRY